MVRYCPKCGAELKVGANFCLSCGYKIESQTPPMNQNAQQPYAPPPVYQPMPQKSNMKLIMAIIAIIVIVVVIAVVFFVVLGGGSDGRFVGTWNIVSSGGTTMPEGTTMIFESNGDLKVGSTLSPGVSATIGTWSVEGGKLCIEAGSVYGAGKECASYSFSNGGNSVTLYDPTGGSNNLVLSK